MGNEMRDTFEGCNSNTHGFTLSVCLFTFFAASAMRLEPCGAIKKPSFRLARAKR